VLIYVVTRFLDCTRFGGTYTKIGTIQRRLAWPLRTGRHAFFSVPQNKSAVLQKILSAAAAFRGEGMKVIAAHVLSGNAFVDLF